jgi:tartrate-resistant acid phosphatase type 5
LVLAGHDHTYERFVIDGLTYVVLGLGGARLYGFQGTLPYSEVRYNAAHGAALLEASDAGLKIQVFAADGKSIDRFVLNPG